MTPVMEALCKRALDEFVGADSTAIPRILQMLHEIAEHNRFYA